MKQEDTKILIPICRDHFRKLAKGESCITCPSKLENEELVNAMAELYKSDSDGTIKAIFIEIQSIRRFTKEHQKETLEHKKMLDEIENQLLTNKHALFGVSGTNGINGDVKILKANMATQQKFMWVLIGMAVVVNILIPVIAKIIN